MRSPTTADRPVEGCGNGADGAGGRRVRPARRRTGAWRLGRWARRGGDVPAPHTPWWRAGWARLDAVGDDGMATAEYAIATIAAAGFAGLLVVVLRSDEVRGLLTGLVRTALSM